MTKAPVRLRLSQLSPAQASIKQHPGTARGGKGRAVQAGSNSGNADNGAHFALRINNCFPADWCHYVQYSTQQDLGIV
jgi:hypothetical protein